MKYNGQFEVTYRIITIFSIAAQTILIKLPVQVPLRTPTKRIGQISPEIPELSVKELTKNSHYAVKRENCLYRSNLSEI